MEASGAEDYLDYENVSIIKTAICPACKGVRQALCALDRSQRIPHIAGAGKNAIDGNTHLNAATNYYKDIYKI